LNSARLASTGGAWLSGDGGRSWARVSVPTGHGAQPQFSDAVATAAGFLLVRPARVHGVPAADVYRSANGTAWTFAATLTTPAGFTPGLMNGGPSGAVLTGRSGSALTAFLSSDGARWRQAPMLGGTASGGTGSGGTGSGGTGSGGTGSGGSAETISGVASVGAGAVIAAGTSSSLPGGSQRLITVTGTAARVRSLNLAAIPGAVQPQLAVNAVAAQGGRQVTVGGANGFPAAWVSADGGRTWHRAAGRTPAVLSRPGIQQLTGVAAGSAGWLAVGGVTAGAAQHPVVLTSADGGTWSAADGLPAFAGAGLHTQQAAAGHGRYVIVGYQQGTRGATAAAWWSAGALTRWQRAPEGKADGMMLAVTATADGFAAAGSHGALPAVWLTRDGSTWKRADLPIPFGVGTAVLWHVAAQGRTVVATGSAQVNGMQVPFAVNSADDGRTWLETMLPVPAGPTQVTASVTAEAAAGDAFTASGVFTAGSGQQDVVVWTSRDGRTWKAVPLAGPGLASPGIQAITGLAASGRSLTGVGFAASPASEQPTLWQIRIGK
jgi:hypothetical protein